jgi:hypothetical protein
MQHRYPGSPFVQAARFEIPGMGFIRLQRRPAKANKIRHLVLSLRQH